MRGVKMYKNIFVAIFLVAIVTGCSSYTKEMLVEKHRGSYSCNVEGNYQDVYRTILSKAKEKYQAEAIIQRMVVNGDLYHDIKQGEVLAVFCSVYGFDSKIYYKINALSDDVSTVTVYYARWGSGPGKDLEEWFGVQDLEYNNSPHSSQ